MVFGFFKKRDDAAHQKIERMHKNIHSWFSNIRRDIDQIGDWISHFKNKHDNHDVSFEKTHKRLEKLEKEMEEMRGFWTRVQTGQTRVQTRVQNGQTRVQTRVGQTDVRLKQMSVQTNNLEKIKNLSITEKKLMWILVNTMEKMRYEDLCRVLGKNKSTLRGQINNIKLKSPGLVKEIVENDGTKRFYVEENLKEEVLGREKRVQVLRKRVKRDK